MQLYLDHLTGRKRWAVEEAPKQNGGVIVHYGTRTRIGHRSWLWMDSSARF
jgi:hypothetical protein